MRQEIDVWIPIAFPLEPAGYGRAGDQKDNCDVPRLEIHVLRSCALI
jgi:hypothetical protein